MTRPQQAAETARILTHTWLSPLALGTGWHGDTFDHETAESTVDEILQTVREQMLADLAEGMTVTQVAALLTLLAATLTAAQETINQARKEGQ